MKPYDIIDEILSVRRHLRKNAANIEFMLNSHSVLLTNIMLSAANYTPLVEKYTNGTLAVRKNNIMLIYSPNGPPQKIIFVVKTKVCYDYLEPITLHYELCHGKIKTSKILVQYSSAQQSLFLHYFNINELPKDIRSKYWDKAGKLFLSVVNELLILANNFKDKIVNYNIQRRKNMELLNEN